MWRCPPLSRSPYLCPWTDKASVLSPPLSLPRLHPPSPTPAHPPLQSGRCCHWNMRRLADTQRALQAVERLQAKLKERGEVPTEEKLSLLKSVLQSPLFHQILALQKSVQHLRDQVKWTFVFHGRPLFKVSTTMHKFLSIKSLNRHVNNAVFILLSLAGPLGLSTCYKDSKEWWVARPMEGYKVLVIQRSASHEYIYECKRPEKPDGCIPLCQHRSNINRSGHV